MLLTITINYQCAAHLLMLASTFLKKKSVENHWRFQTQQAIVTDCLLPIFSSQTWLAGKPKWIYQKLF